jgi:C1A family cysteine protease
MKSFINLTILLVVLNVCLSSSEIKQEEYTTIKNILKNFMNEKPKELFKVYHFLYKKPYDLNTEEGIARYRIFKKKLAYIKETNAKNLPYKLGLNHFTDYTNEEYRKLLTKRNIQGGELENLLIGATPLMTPFEQKPFLFDDYVDEEEHPDSGLNTNIDWRSKFNPIRDQGQCGSCWTFSTTGA